MMRPDLLELEEYTPIEPLEKLSERLGICRLKELSNWMLTKTPTGATRPPWKP